MEQAFGSFLTLLKAAGRSPRTKIYLENVLERDSTWLHCLLLSVPKNQVGGREAVARGIWKLILADFFQRREAEGLPGVKVGGSGVREGSSRLSASWKFSVAGVRGLRLFRVKNWCVFLGGQRQESGLEGRLGGAESTTEGEFGV